MLVPSHMTKQIRILVGTGTATNIVTKAYHQYVMTQCPSMVTKYIECGSDTEYDDF